MEIAYCFCCGQQIDDGDVCDDCRAEIEMMRALDRLRDGIGTPDELADYEATRRMIQSGE